MQENSHSSHPSLSPVTEYQQFPTHVPTLPDPWEVAPHLWITQKHHNFSTGCFEPKCQLFSVYCNAKASLCLAMSALGKSSHTETLFQSRQAHIEHRL